MVAAVYPLEVRTESVPKESEAVDALYCISSDGGMNCILFLETNDQLLSFADIKGQVVPFVLKSLETYVI